MSFGATSRFRCLRTARRRLGLLAELIEPKARKIVIADVEDEIGPGVEIGFPQMADSVDKGRFKMKGRRFLEDHHDHISVLKIRRGAQLTPQDLSELERIFIENGAAPLESVAAIQAEGGLGRFLRSLTGLDRSAAKTAFNMFSASRQLAPDPLEFLDLIVDSLTENGFVDPASFYASPFTDIDDQGIRRVFSTDEAQEMIAIVRKFNEAAAA